jgi:HEAT repeat protein
VSVFTQGAQGLMVALESDQIDTRRWSLETIQALAADEDQALIPLGTLPLFLGGVGCCLIKESDDSLRDLAVECTALLVGSVATSGDLEGARSHLARILHDVGDSGPELRTRLLSSMSLSLAPLRLFFREGRSVLESRVLPLFRMAGPDGARGLIRHLEEEENRHRRSRILELLKALAPLSFEPVKESLKAEAWYVVRNALNLLGELGDPDSFEAASRFLEHPDLRIQRAAVRAFWKTGGLRTESYLLDLLPRCDPETQSEILVGLTQIGASSATGPIAELAPQVEETLRIKCIETLGQLGHPDAIPALGKFLEQKGRIFKTREAASVREAAAKALMAIGTPEAAACLAQAVLEAPRNGDQETLRKISKKPIWG